MMAFLMACLLLLAIVVPALAAIPEDRVHELPGWPGDLPSVQYSGFLEVDASAGRFLHYWLVMSEGDPARDPVVLWLNGGPGCSSLDGYLYEHGPLHFGPGLSLEKNPWSWTRSATVIYLEAPAGVGFSFSQTPSDYNTNDNQTAKDNHKAVQMLFQGFPELAKGQKFYISGESYAGIYVPVLSRLVLADTSLPQFAGILVGNGVTDDKYDSMQSSFLPFVTQHALVSQETAANINKNCPTNPEGAACKAAEQVVFQNFQDINVYDIYLDCWTQRPHATFLPHHRMLAAASNIGEMVPCINSEKATDWLNRPDVKAALHVERSPLTWAICSNVVNYTSQYSTVIPIYRDLIAAKKRVLVYSG